MVVSWVKLVAKLNKYLQYNKSYLFNHLKLCTKLAQNVIQIFIYK